MYNRQNYPKASKYLSKIKKGNAPSEMLAVETAFINRSSNVARNINRNINRTGRIKEIRELSLSYLEKASSIGAHEGFGVYEFLALLELFYELLLALKGSERKISDSENAEILHSLWSAFNVATKLRSQEALRSIRELLTEFDIGQRAGSKE